jgi:hypothetical protein
MKTLRRFTARVASIAVLSALLVSPAIAGASPGHPAGIDLAAPVITREDILIHASPWKIWAIQTDIENWPSWQPEVNSAHRVDPGRLEAGSVFEWEVQGLRVTSTVEQVVPRRRLVWGGPGNGIVAVHVWTFTPVRDGVRVHTEESWAGAPVEADVPYAQAALDASLTAWLENLKRVSETRS